MAETISIKLETARRMALHAQLLDGRTKLPKGKEGVAKAIEHLGYVQIDTISVIERAHNHTIWTRRPDFTPTYLHELQAVDRRIFEYWGHAASFLPICDYRFYIPRMNRFREPKSNSKWEMERIQRSSHMMKPVLERVRNEGPLGSRDFHEPGSGKKGTWWDWQPAKVALELLFWMGELMVTERKNFQRLYDLTERVLPAEVDTTCPDGDELNRFLARRALQSMGIATEKEIQDHLWGSGKNEVGNALYEFADSGEVVKLKIEGIDKADYFATASLVEKFHKLRKPSSELHLLSPFDNAVIHRERNRRLFNFDYTIECYVPQLKRKHGYFVCPILWGDRFVGRMDPKADRKTRTLLINSLSFEKGFEAFDDFIPVFADKLEQFAAFNGCEKIELIKVAPAKITSSIRKYINW
jgi:uncharacterized protein